MLIKSFDYLSPVKRRTVIINHNTKPVTFLALLAALKHAKNPLLLIDCESTDGSFDFFLEKMQHHKFDLMQAPLNEHGKTLDFVFSNSNDEELLLIDSDLEIHNSEIIAFFDRYIQHEKVFGCGFLNGSFKLKKNFENTRLYGALYFERPYMPIVLLKVDYVKNALKNGISFNYKTVNNQFGLLNSSLSRYLLFAFRKLHLQTPSILRKEYFTHKPKLVVYDTGAKIYEYLRFNKHLYFVNLPCAYENLYVTHFFGLTRNLLRPEDNNVGFDKDSINKTVAQRLKSEYNQSIES